MSEPSLSKQSAWLFTAKVIGFVISFALPLVLVRHLDRQEFGIYRQAFILVNTLIAILPFGIGMTAFYYFSREEEKRALAVSNILLVHLFVGAMAFIILTFAPTIIGSLFNEPAFEHLSPLIGALILTWTFSFFLETVAVANKEPKTALVFITLAQATKATFLIFAVTVFGSLSSILMASIFQGILQSTVLLAYLNRRFPRFWTKFDRAFFWEHLSYALPLGAAGVLWIAQTDLHFYFVGSWFSSDQFAIYAVGCFQLPLIAMLMESVGSVLIPRMSQLQMAGQTEEMLRLTAKAAERLSLVYFPVYVFVLIVAESMITVLFTAEYAASTGIFRIFITTIPIGVLMLDPIIRAYPEIGRMLLYFRIVTIPLLVGALYLVTATYQSMILVVVTLVAFLIFERVVFGLVMFKKLGATLGDLRLFGPVAKIGFASVLAGIVAFLLYIWLKGPVSYSAGEVLIGLLPTWKFITIETISRLLVLASVFAAFAASYLFLVVQLRIVPAETLQQLRGYLIGLRGKVRYWN